MARLIIKPYTTRAVCAVDRHGSKKTDHELVKHGEDMINHHRRKTKMDRTMVSKCGVILKKLIAHPYGASFYKPVDPVAFEIPDFLSLVSKPMDLGTIRFKLAKDLYRTADEFEADVRLTFSNAMEYNPPCIDFYKMAQELDLLFDALLNKANAVEEEEEEEEVGKMITRKIHCNNASGNSKRVRMDRMMVCRCVVILKRLMRKAGEGSELMKGLHRIRSNMVKDLYATPREFEADIRRTLSNAVKYNPSSNPIHNKARKLNSVFTAHWKALQHEQETER